MDRTVTATFLHSDKVAPCGHAPNAMRQIERTFDGLAGTAGTDQAGNKKTRVFATRTIHPRDLLGTSRKDKRRLPNSSFVVTLYFK